MESQKFSDTVKIVYLISLCKRKIFLKHFFENFAFYGLDTEQGLEPEPEPEPEPEL
jgi:hypothetical protein